MLRVTEKLSILVATVIDRSRIYRLLGSERARGSMKKLSCDLSGIARNTNGETLQADEDRLMCAFISADDVVVAAAGMHQFIGSWPLRWQLFICLRTWKSVLEPARFSGKRTICSTRR